MSTPSREAAQMIWQHWRSHTALDALPTAVRPRDRAEGYAAQAHLPAVSGRGVVGWKIAATSVAGQRHINVSGPLAGRLLEGQVDADGATVSLEGNRMNVAEPEFAFRVGTELVPRAAAYTVHEVLDAVDALHLALEIPDSRFTTFTRAGEAQLLADNACAQRFVIGPPVTANWRGLDLRSHAVQAKVFDASGCRLSRDGDGSAVLGDPRVALAWLVNELSGLGIALAAGQIVSTGTCMVPLDIRPGGTVQASYGVLGQISMRAGS